MIQPLFGFRSATNYRPGKPLRDPAYLSFVRRLGFCVCCGTTRNIEAAHTGFHGLSQKSGDDTAINLCHGCHRTGPKSLHKLGPVRFAEVHRLDVAGHIATLNQFYQTKIRRAA